jgi:hypothetical protein
MSSSWVPVQQVPQGNTNIPTIMVAEKLSAEMLRESG